MTQNTYETVEIVVDDLVAPLLSIDARIIFGLSKSFQLCIAIYF